MPNWCYNTVELTHEDPTMIERARTAFLGKGLLNEFVPVPKELQIVAGFLGDEVEQAALEAREAANLEKHGYRNWYDYCVNEWGTKWDVTGQEVNDIPNGVILTFDSAWAPPTGAYDKLLDLGFEVRAMYYEPGMGFCGVWDNGQDDEYSLGGLNSDEVAELLPPELDEAYGISESIAEYEDEENIDIELNGGIDSINE